MQLTSTVDLSEREGQFVAGLVSGLAPSSAARSAGYSVGHTRALLAKPAVTAALVAVVANAQEALRLAAITVNPPAKASRETHR